MKGEKGKGIRENTEGRKWNAKQRGEEELERGREGGRKDEKGLGGGDMGKRDKEKEEKGRRKMGKAEGIIDMAE